jgi:hypothetical protein
MSQIFAENNNENKNECCVCYNDNSEESNEEGKLIECCPNKHILCVGCFHKSYERKCECPLCRELMFRPEIMTDVEAFAYYGAKVALNDRRAREEQQRQIRLAEAERQRVIAERQRAEAERQRQVQLEHLQVRKTERKQRIQRHNDELLGQIAINNAEIENIDNLDLDAYNAIYPPNFELSRAAVLQPTNIISSDSDTDDNDSVEIIYNPPPRTDEGYDSDDVRDYFISQLASSPPRRVVQQPVARPVQIHPVARPLTMHERTQIQIRQELRQQSVARPVTQEQIQQPVARPVQQPVARPVQQRRSPTYARDKLRQDEILVQVLNGDRMFLKYNRLNDTFIRADNNRVYPTLNSASVAHAEEVGLSYHPNAWTTFKRSDGSRIDNL